MQIPTRTTVIPLLAVFILALVRPPIADAEDWPQFRGPRGLGVSKSDKLPTSWSDEENVRWKVELPGAGASSPIAIGDRLYLTAYSGYGIEGKGGELDDLRLHVLAISAKNGETIWQRELEAVQPESDRVRDHGYAAPTPVSDGEALFVFFGKTGVLRYSLDGEKAWQTSVGTKTHGWGCGTSPVLFENLVIVNASVESGSLVALDKKTGKEVWRARGMEESWNTPHLIRLENGKTELVVSVKDRILAFDPKSGEKLWECEGIHDYVCPSIVSADGVLYVIGGRQSQSIAVRAGGRGDVTETHRLWTAKAGANVSSPVVVGDYLYWVSDRNQVAYCVRRKDGEVMYAERAELQPYASSLAAGGRIYVTSRRGETLVLAAEPELREIARNKLSDRSLFNASPIVADDSLILRSDRYLYSIGKTAARTAAQ